MGRTAQHERSGLHLRNILGQTRAWRGTSLFQYFARSGRRLRYIRPFMHDRQERSFGTRAVRAMPSVLLPPNITCIATLSATEFTSALQCYQPGKARASRESISEHRLPHVSCIAMLAMSARGCRGHRRHTVTVALWSVGNVRSPHRRASHALDDGRPREVKKTLESRRCSHDLDGLQQYPVSLLHGIRPSWNDQRSETTPSL